MEDRNNGMSKELFELLMAIASNLDSAKKASVSNKADVARFHITIVDKETGETKIDEDVYGAVITMLSANLPMNEASPICAMIGGLSMMGWARLLHGAEATLEKAQEANPLAYSLSKSFAHRAVPVDSMMTRPGGPNFADWLKNQDDKTNPE